MISFILRLHIVAIGEISAKISFMTDSSEQLQVYGSGNSSVSLDIDSVVES